MKPENSSTKIIHKKSVNEVFYVVQAELINCSILLLTTWPMYTCSGKKGLWLVFNSAIWKTFNKLFCII